MAQWKDDNGDATFDDGLTLKPGEEDFTRAVAEQHFKHPNFSYMGTPNWAPQAEEEPLTNHG